MKNIKSHNTEKGQAIIYLAIGMIIFLGFVALAIDGGMALAARRNSQNSADAASLAGGGQAALYLENQHVYSDNWSCSNPNVIAAMNTAISAAKSRAATNNLPIDNNISDHNGIAITCAHINRTYYWDNYIDVTVEISSTTQSNFARLIFPNAIKNQVEAVTRIRPRQPLALGNCIVALNTDSCQGHQNGGVMYGNGLVHVTSGTIWTNGCLRGNGHPNVSADQGIFGNNLDLGGAAWTPAPTQVNYQIPPSTYNIPLPDCSDPAAHNVSSLPNNMSEGLYCVSGSLTLHGTYTGSGVTIYLATGGITINGNAKINISAPAGNPDQVAPAIPHILIYLPPSNHSTVKLNGTADSTFVGTILAPGADITINGTNGTNAYHSQVIGWNVLVGGTADTYVTYEGSENAGFPTAIELYK